MSMCCSLCQGKNLEKFIDLGRQPLANKYPKSTDFEEEKFFPLEVFFLRYLQKCTARRNGPAGPHV